jgi:hypothetical protein
MAECKILYPNFPERNKDNQDIFSARIGGVPTEIQLRNLSNRSQKCETFCLLTAGLVVALAETIFLFLLRILQLINCDCGHVGYL